MKGLFYFVYVVFFGIFVKDFFITFYYYFCYYYVVVRYMYCFPVSSRIKYLYSILVIDEYIIDGVAYSLIWVIPRPLMNVFVGKNRVGDY